MPSPWWSRETRLLILTIVVSIAALTILARFRFPSEDRIQPPQPLERLAARATFDELASIVERLERRIAPSLVILRVSTPDTDTPRSLQALINRSAEIARTPTFVIGLRLRPDVVIARLVAGEGTIVQMLGDASAMPLVLATDPIRQLALVRVPPPADDVDWTWQPAEEFPVPRYVVAVEGSRGGATPHPIFLGRADRIEEPRWASPLLVLARTPVTAEGALVFSLDARLIGMVTLEAGVLAIVPATTLLASAEQLLESGTTPATDFGLMLQPVTRELVSELGITGGVVVTSVAAGAPAAGLLRPDDLIQALDGQPVSNPDATLLRLAHVPSSATARFTIRRDGETLEIEVPAARVPEPASPRARQSRPRG